MTLAHVINLRQPSSHKEEGCFVCLYSPPLSLLNLFVVKVVRCSGQRSAVVSFAPWRSAQSRSTLPCSHAGPRVSCSSRSGRVQSGASSAPWGFPSLIVRHRWDQCQRAGCFPRAVESQTASIYLLEAPMGNCCTWPGLEASGARSNALARQP